jgi:hypothetical protein
LVSELPYWWRVTRYDPANRDETGGYIGDTWLGIGAVGEVFDGKVLTMEEYMAVEDAYVAAFRAFAVDSGVEVVEVRRYERGDGVRPGDRLSIEAAGDIVRLMLRGEVSCKLEALDNSFAYHVGYDLYSYIGSHAPCARALAATQAGVLFVDEGFVSVYLNQEDPPDDDDDD